MLYLIIKLQPQSYLPEGVKRIPRSNSLHVIWEQFIYVWP